MDMMLNSCPMHDWMNNMMMGGGSMMMGGGFIMMIIPIAVLLISSILFSRFVYHDATHRHFSNADVWGFVAFFLNILGLILYILLRGGYTIQEPVGQVTRTDSSVKMGSTTISSNATLQTKPEILKQAPFYCPMCGGERAPSANFCTKCGTAFN